MAETARKLYEQTAGDTGAVLVDIVKSASTDIPGAQHAGITIAANHGQIESGPVSDPYASTIDRIQQRYREGPCLAAALEHQTFFVDDIATDDRWPSFRAAV